MIQFPRPFRAAVNLSALLATLLGSSLSAAAVSQSYDVLFNGVKAGALSLTGDVDGSRYSAQAKVQSSGLVSRLFSFGFAGSATGSLLRSGALRPSQYAGVSVTRDRRRETRIRYRGGTPGAVTFQPERKARSYDAPPAGQGGTRDPISATLEILRPRPAAQTCGQTIEIFDGNKRSRIRIEPRQRAGDRWACKGVYTRIQGWRAKDLAEKRNFTFTVFFRDAGNGMMRADGFETQTTFGKVSVVRR